MKIVKALSVELENKQKLFINDEWANSCQLTCIHLHVHRRKVSACDGPRCLHGSRLACKCTRDLLSAHMSHSPCEAIASQAEVGREKPVFAPHNTYGKNGVA